MDWEDFVIGFLVSLVVVFVIHWAGGVYDSSVKNYELGECAEGQDLAMRETTGTAKIFVNFKDGEVTEVRCASADLKFEHQ